MKIPISTIGAIMNNFNQHKMLRNCLEEDVCLYRPNAQRGGDFEWDSARTTAGELQKIVESQKIVKQHLHHSPHVVWEGFKKNDPCSSKNKLQHIRLSNMTGTSNGTGFYGQMKLKMRFLAANTQDGFGEHRDKKYPMCTIKYTVVVFYVVGLIFCCRSWTSCLDTWHHGLYQIPTDKKIKQVTDL